MCTISLLCFHKHRVTHQLNNMTNSQLSLTYDNDRLYSQATTPQPNIYSTLTKPHGEITEEEQLAGYSAISNTATYVTASTTGASDDMYNHTHHGNIAPPTMGDINNAGYSVITKTPDTSNEGLVYSSVVVKDGFETTVETTVFKD